MKPHVDTCPCCNRKAQGVEFTGPLWVAGKRGPAFVTFICRDCAPTMWQKALSWALRLALGLRK